MLDIPRFELDQASKEGAVNAFNQLGITLPMMQLRVPEAAELKKKILPTKQDKNTMNTIADGFDDAFYGIADSVFVFLDIRGELLDEKTQSLSGGGSMLDALRSDYFISKKPRLYLQGEGLTYVEGEAPAEPGLGVHVDTTGASKADFVYAMHVNIAGEGEVKSGLTSPRRASVRGRVSELTHEVGLDPNVISVFVRRGVFNSGLEKIRSKLNLGQTKVPLMSLHAFSSSPNERRLFTDVSFVVNPQAVNSEGRIL